MEPIPYFYDTINRSAIVVKLKQPMFDWINKQDPDHPTPFAQHSKIYLVKEKENEVALQNWLKRNFDAIFQNELNDWCTDESQWPLKRTYKMFAEWFEVSVHDTVMDMEEADITKW